jgi:hypothetical protein
VSRGRWHRLEVQDPVTHRTGQAVREGPLRGRPGRRHRHLSRRRAGRDPQGRHCWRNGHFRRRVLRVHDGRQLHDRKQCRTIRVGSHEQTLASVRNRQRDPEWIADYRARWPKVERKLVHLMRRRHGGRRARVRGRIKVDADFRLLAAPTNLARLATLGVQSSQSTWTLASS